jgi:hypothetical protein
VGSIVGGSVGLSAGNGAAVEAGAGLAVGADGSAGEIACPLAQLDRNIAANINGIAGILLIIDPSVIGNCIPKMRTAVRPWNSETVPKLRVEGEARSKLVGGTVVRGSQRHIEPHEDDSPAHLPKFVVIIDRSRGNQIPSFFSIGRFKSRCKCNSGNQFTQISRRRLRLRAPCEFETGREPGSSI